MPRFVETADFIVDVVTGSSNSAIRASISLASLRYWFVTLWFGAVWKLSSLTFGTEVQP
ncbi:hypothetical protein [Nostoc sp.]